MKHTLVVFILTLLSVTLQAQETTVAFSRWSATLEIGPSMFDGDVGQTRMQLLPTSFQQVSYGGTAEYALTPVWGLAGDFYHFALSGRNADIYFYTPYNTVSLSGTANITRLLFPRTKSRWCFNASLGLGYAYYVSQYRYPNPDNSPLVKLPGQSITLPVTGSVEYLFNKKVSLGGKLHYRANNKDNLEGADKYNFKGVTNDYISAVTLYCRYRFLRTDNKHVRNISTATYTKFYNPVVPQSGCCDKIAVFDSLLVQYAGRLKQQKEEIDSLKTLLANDRKDTDKDGVPDTRDKEPDTAAGAMVDFWGRAYKNQPLMNELSDNSSTRPYTTASLIKNRNSISTIKNDTIPSVYFDFDKFTLDKEAKEIIQKVAAKMKNSGDLMVEVRGYCDFLGNLDYNAKLSQNRSDRVKEELVQVWGIAPERIIANGNGRIDIPENKYRKNRRCDFFFSK